MDGRAAAERRSDQVDIGKHAEDLVNTHLLDLGWQICGRNVRVGRYELDIIAIEERTVVVVEVRTRGEGAWTSPIGSIDGGKRRRLRNAGQRIWRDQFKHRPDIDRLRFDVVAVRFDELGQPVIEHIRAAFA